jgi:hypothetical protein
MIKRYKEYSQGYEYDTKGINVMKRHKNGYSIKIGMRTETCQKSVNDI